MYERKLDGRTLTFGHMGSLFNDSFVFYDHQTDSMWIHFTGEAFFGPLKGRKLKFFPSTVTTWEKWKAAYPHTKVLDGRRAGAIMGSYLGMERESGLGLSVVVRFKAKLYPFELLKKQPLLNDRFNGVALLVYFSQKRRTATAWGRLLDGRELRFAKSARVDAHGDVLLEDQQTGSRWNWLTGEAVGGPLRGRKLEQLLYNPVFNDRFKVFYPGAPVYGEGAGDKG